MNDSDYDTSIELIEDVKDIIEFKANSSTIFFNGNRLDLADVSENLVIGREVGSKLSSNGEYNTILLSLNSIL